MSFIFSKKEKEVLHLLQIDQIVILQKKKAEGGQKNQYLMKKLIF